MGAPVQVREGYFPPPPHFPEPLAGVLFLQPVGQPLSRDSKLLLLLQAGRCIKLPSGEPL